MDTNTSRQLCNRRLKVFRKRLTEFVVALLRVTEPSEKEKKEMMNSVMKNMSSGGADMTTAIAKSMNYVQTNKMQFYDQLYQYYYHMKKEKRHVRTLFEDYCKYSYVPYRNNYEILMRFLSDKNGESSRKVYMLPGINFAKMEPMNETIAAAIVAHIASIHKVTKSILKHHEEELLDLSESDSQAESSEEEIEINPDEISGAVKNIFGSTDMGKDKNFSYIVETATREAMSTLNESEEMKKGLASAKDMGSIVDLLGKVDIFDMALKSALNVDKDLKKAVSDGNFDKESYEKIKASIAQMSKNLAKK